MSPSKLYSNSHLPNLYRCLNFNGTYTELLDHLKSAPRKTLAKCNYLPWVLHIESPNATEPFITKTPHDIYNSDEAPVMDAMFTFASQVIAFRLTSSPFISLQFASSTFFLCLSFHQESIKIFPNETEWTIPFLEDQKGLVLPYENFNQFSHPRVNKN